MDKDLHGQPTQAQPTATPKLEITTGEDAGQTFSVKMTTRLGRELDNDITIVNPKMSRYHAQIHLENGQWLITDLGSSNHTFVNDEQINQPIALQHEDRVRLGEVELVFTNPAFHSDRTMAGKPIKKEAPVAAPLPAIAPAPAPQQQGNSRLFFIIGGFVILLCLAAGILVFFLVGSFDPAGGETPVAEATSEIVPEPTEEVSNEATDEADPAEEPSSSDLVLVYEDDFSDSFGGWDDASDTHTSKQYGNNRYQIEVRTSNLIAWGLSNRVVGDFDLEVEARREDGGETNSYGLLFHFQDRNNFYRYDISGDGFYLLSKFIDGEWVTLVDWTASPHISPDTNLIGVSVIGSEITLKANGQVLTTTTDDSLKTGTFGFFASTFNEPYMWVSYDNLKFWTPEDQEIVLIPTVTRPASTLASAPTETPEPASDTVGEEAVAEEEFIVDEHDEEAIAEIEVEEEAVEEEAEPIAQAETETNDLTAQDDSAPTPTPVPLPSYASRDQPLARGQDRLEGRIIFPVYDAERGMYDVYAADVNDGRNLELVQAEASQPTFNPDGTDFGYRSWQRDKRGVFAKKIGSEDEWGFDLFFESARPQFSPDGTIIYYSRSGGEQPALYMVLDGEGQLMRRDGVPIQGLAPKWAPDGQQFVYSSCVGGTCGIKLGHRDGSFSLLTDQPSDINPEISPDGETIVFMSERSGDWEIYRMDLDGQNLEALTNDDASDGLPTWSPDGDHIAFASNRDGEWGIWSMAPDGSDQRRLFTLDGPIDGIVQHDIGNSKGWLEENIDWAP